MSDMGRSSNWTKSAIVQYLNGSAGDAHTLHSPSVPQKPMVSCGTARDTEPLTTQGSLWPAGAP
jgi:hypothetical protein